jgi:sortase A
MDTSELDAARAAASAYNETLLTVPDKPFTKDALIKASESYDTLLNVREDGIMGYVEIPAIGVNLPIYHGTEESTLDRGVGHLLGSSLPVGGAATHCVLTGHSGLAGQKMFSDLNLLKEGDIFFLRVMGETLAYRVTDIYTVLPEDTGKLTIDAGRDLCTLVTCTPYGVNSHRLLLRGERTEYEEAVSVIEDAEFTPVEESTWGDEYRHGLICGGLAVAGIGACYGGYRAILHARRPKRRRYAMRRERMRGRHEAH